WIATFALLERIYRDLAGHFIESLCAVAVSLVLIVAWCPSVLTFTFFPIVTVSSALLFFASGAALVAGRFRWIWAFVLGALMLVHEHASFIGLVPLMAAVLLAMTTMAHRELKSIEGIGEVFRRDRASFVAAGLIALVFILPIVVDVVTAFPGEFLSYLT